MKHKLGRTLLGFSYHCICWLLFIMYSAYSPLLCCLYKKTARNEMKLMQLSAGFGSPLPWVQHSWLLGRAVGEHPASPARDRRAELHSYTSYCTGAPFLCCCGLWRKKLLSKYAMGQGGKIPANNICCVHINKSYLVLSNLAVHLLYTSATVKQKVAPSKNVADCCSQECSRLLYIWNLLNCTNSFSRGKKRFINKRTKKFYEMTQVKKATCTHPLTFPQRSVYQLRR